LCLYGLNNTFSSCCLYPRLPYQPSIFCSVAAAHTLFCNSGFRCRLQQLLLWCLPSIAAACAPLSSNSSPLFVKLQPICDLRHRLQLVFPLAAAAALALDSAAAAYALAPIQQQLPICSTAAECSFLLHQQFQPLFSSVVCSCSGYK
jgi:hypothetical protein